MEKFGGFVKKIKDRIAPKKTEEQIAKKEEAAHNELLDSLGKVNPHALRRYNEDQDWNDGKDH